MVLIQHAVHAWPCREQGYEAVCMCSCAAAAHMHKPQEFLNHAGSCLQSEQSHRCQLLSSSGGETLLTGHPCTSICTVDSLADWKVQQKTPAGCGRCPRSCWHFYAHEVPIWELGCPEAQQADLWDHLFRCFDRLMQTGPGRWSIRELLWLTSKSEGM